MAEGRIRVLEVVPGPTGLPAVVREFCRLQEGYITAFPDSALPHLRTMVDESSFIEILEFGNLVRKSLKLCGQEPPFLIPAAHAAAAVGKACERLEPDSPFYLSRRFGGAHRAIADALADLYDAGIGPDEWQRIEPLASPALAAKLRSLRDIDAVVNEYLEEVNRCRFSDLVRSCIDEIPELDDAPRRILVYAGSERSYQRERWLRWAAEIGYDITVAIDRHATGADLFREGASLREALAHEGAEVRAVGAGTRLQNALFAESAEGGVDVALEVVSAADAMAECEWAIRRAFEVGPGNLAIYARDLETYAPLLIAAARRFGVPLRIARREPLMANSFARLTLGLLECVAGDTVRPLAAVVRSSFVDSGSMLRQELEPALKDCHGHPGGEWEALGFWLRDREDTASVWLREVVEWRRVALAEPTTPAEWLARLRDLMGNLPWMKAPTGTVEAMERDSNAMVAMQRGLAADASVDTFFSPEPIALATFVAKCRSTWESGDYSIPRLDEGVTVSRDADQLGYADTVVALGMLEGVFPRRRREATVLHDDDRRELAELVPEAGRLADSFAIARRERDLFYKVASAARSRLALSYPETDEDRDNVPAFYIAAAESAAGEAKRIAHPRNQYAPEAGACANEADRQLRRALESDRDEPLPIEMESEAGRALLKAPEEAAYTLSELRAAIECPFQFQMKHRLKALPRGDFERWNLLPSLPRKTALAAQPNLHDAQRALDDSLDELLDRMAPETGAWERRLVREGASRVFRGWLEREARARETWPRDNVRPNVPFTEFNSQEKRPAGLRLKGAIDAVSDFGAFRIAHVYTARSLGESWEKKLDDAKKLEIGLLMLAIYEPGRRLAVEMEGVGDHRILFLLGRNENDDIVGGEGLTVINVIDGDDKDEKKKFIAQVKELAAKAMAVAREGRIDAIPGDHCQTCGYLDLCRRSRDASELENPFEPESGEDAAGGDE